MFKAIEQYATTARLGAVSEEQERLREMAVAMLEYGDEVRTSRMLAAAAQGGTLAVAGEGNGEDQHSDLVMEVSKPLNRVIYDGKFRAGLPGDVVRTEGESATNDQSVDDVYDGTGVAWHLYFEQCGRNSIDGLGMQISATVHHRRNYNNAFWDGKQLTFGDGDNEIFHRLTDLAIIGHEMSHGVVQHSGGLEYQGESGALNESFADVFGALTVQYQLDQNASDANWLIGENVFTEQFKEGGQIQAIRSMKAPGTAYDHPIIGKDPQPMHIEDYDKTADDNGGVHINSGIPNHAFYQYSISLGGKAWEKSGRVWYDALQRINNPRAKFADWVEATEVAAITRYGENSPEVQKLRDAWGLVGLDPTIR